ncbi:MAG: proton-translocating transhydrogenase family protein [Planctomycetota bacterium]
MCWIGGGFRPYFSTDTSGSRLGYLLFRVIVVAGALATGAGTLLGFLAVVLAMINVAGGFVVTHRMLEMFQPKKK